MNSDAKYTAYCNLCIWKDTNFTQKGQKRKEITLADPLPVYSHNCMWSERLLQ